MARVRVVSRGWVNVSNEKSKSILQWKDNTNIDQRRMVELNSTESAELQDIKQVLLDDPSAITMGMDNDAKTNERERQTREFEQMKRMYAMQGVEEKARRMIRTWCSLLWTARGNKPAMQIPKELQDELMIVLIPFFDENQNEWHAPQKIYNHLIPFGKITVSSVSGMKTIGQQLQGSLV